MERLHNTCLSVVSYATVSNGYSCCCLSCDEDLYLFETHLSDKGN